MKTCHNMNIIVQNTGGNDSSLNGKSEIPNKTLANITRAILLNSSHKKELLCFAYKYPYVSPAEPRIYFVVTFLTYSGMEQDLHTNI